MHAQRATIVGKARSGHAPFSRFDRRRQAAVWRPIE
jgi:hypothetical protein